MRRESPLYPLQGARGVGARYALLLLLALLVVGCVPRGPKYARFFHLPPKALGLWFLDVGQGDAALLRTPGGKFLLIDTGPPESSSRLLDYLDSAGVKEIALLVNSHPHADHIGGASAVLRKYKVKRVLDPGFEYPSSVYRDLLREVKKRRVPFQLSAVGDTFEFDGVKIELLGPGRPFITHTASDPNNNSIILRVTYGRTRVLFSGDAQYEEWRRVLSAGLDVRAEILKVPHHGSRDATSGRMLRAIRPKVGIISCGRHNEYHHPHRSTLRLLRRYRVRVYRTDLDGLVKVVVFPNRYQVISEKEEKQGGGDRR